MDARALRLVGGLLLVLALLLGLFAAPPTASGAADGLPAITEFKTAHVTLALAMVRSTGPGRDFAYTGEGDIDNTRRAARFNVVFAGAAYEVVLVDGRLYSRDPDTNKWEWTESTGAGASATDLLGVGDPATADADWRRVGAEQIDGVATTHWRMVLDAEDVKRRAGADRGATADPVEFTFDQSVDLWIGDANGYIYRYAVDLTMSDGRQSGPRTAGAATLKLTYRVELSRHDQPLDIQPPAGASPAADGRAGGALHGLPGRPAGGALNLIGASREDDAGAPPRAGSASTPTGGRNRITYEPAPTRRAAAAVATATTARATTSTTATTRTATPTATAAAAPVAANPPGAAAPGVAGAEVTSAAGKGPGPVAIGLLAALLLGALGAFAAAFRLRAA